MISEMRPSIVTQGQFEFYSVTEHGVEFKPNTPREVWLDFVKQGLDMWENSGRLHCRATFILADACNAGEELYGEEYAAAIDNTRAFIRLQNKTIANLMWIAKKVAPTRRRELLSMSHHEIVAKLDDAEQDEFLSQAEQEGLNTKELKERVRDRHPSKPRQSKNGSKPETLTISSLTEAKTTATELSNWLTENEEKVATSGPLMDVLKHISTLYRRIHDRGRQR